MSTSQPDVRTSATRWSATAVTLTGALIAAAVAVVFLVLASGGHRNVVASTQPASTNLPLIQYRGTGAPPAAHERGPATLNPESGQLHGGVVTSTATGAYISRHKSYGAVP